MASFWLFDYTVWISDVLLGDAVTGQVCEQCTAHVMLSLNVIVLSMVGTCFVGNGCQCGRLIKLEVVVKQDAYIDTA